jgi:hypothetical protein
MDDYCRALLHVPSQPQVQLVVTNSALGITSAYITFIGAQPLPNSVVAVEVAAANVAIASGAAPPFILARDAPTEEQTVSLFHLCPEQARPFLLFARAFLSEKVRAAQRLDGVRVNEPIPQLLLLVTGKAGTGKSECAKAFLWFTFQHRHAHLVGVTSYTWKAALLLGNEHNPGYSTSTFFGINAFQPHSIAGSALEVFDADKYMLLLDEGSFTGQRHMMVCDSCISVCNRFVHNSLTPI